LLDGGIHFAASVVCGIGLVGHFQRAGNLRPEEVRSKLSRSLRLKKARINLR